MQYFKYRLTFAGRDAASRSLVETGDPLFLSFRILGVSGNLSVKLQSRQLDFCRRCTFRWADVTPDKSGPWWLYRPLAGGLRAGPGGPHVCVPSPHRDLLLSKKLRPKTKPNSAGESFPVGPTFPPPSPKGASPNPLPLRSLQYGSVRKKKEGGSAHFAWRMGFFGGPF